jgi:hypothetical protein
MDERVGAQVATGDCMGGRSDLPFLPCCYYAKKKGCFGLVAVVSLGERENNRQTSGVYMRTSTSSGNDRFGANQNMTKKWRQTEHDRWRQPALPRHVGN